MSELAANDVNIEDHHSRKRFKIAIEPIEEKRVFTITSDGQERIKPEPTKEEQFSLSLRQIDIEKYADKLSKEKTQEVDVKTEGGEEEKEETSQLIQQAPPQFPWIPVLEPLYRARVEVEHMIGLLNLLLGGQQASLQYMSKITPITYQDLAVREASKKKELSAASSILSSGAAKLKSIINKEQHFFDDLLQIRSKWIVNSRQTTASKKLGTLGKLYVDYSYKSAGSTIKTEAELIETSAGRVSVDFPNSSRQKLYIFTSKDQLNKLISRDVYVQPSETDFHQLITDSQDSQFYNELFQQMTSEALAKPLPYVHLLENEIQVEDEITSYLTLALKDVEKSNSLFSSQKFGDMPTDVLEIALQKLLLHRYKNPDSSEQILDKISAIYKHRCLCERVSRVMREISGNIPSLFTHWYTTEKPLVSAMEMHLGKRYTADIIIDKSSIYYSGGYNRSPFLSANELGRFILFQLKKYLLDEVFKDASAYWKNRVRKDHVNVSIVHSNKNITIGFIETSDYRIDIVMNEVLDDTRELKKRIFTWNMIPGNTPSDKLRYLLANSVHATIDTILDIPKKLIVFKPVTSSSITIPPPKKLVVQKDFSDDINGFLGFGNDTNMIEAVTVDTEESPLSILDDDLLENGNSKHKRKNY